MRCKILRSQVTNYYPPVKIQLQTSKYCWMIQVKINIPDLVQLHHTGRQPSTCPLVPTAGYSNSESQLQCFHVCWQQCLHHLYQALSNEQHAVLAATHLLLSQPTSTTEYTFKNSGSMWSSTEQLNQSHGHQDSLVSGIKNICTFSTAMQIHSTHVFKPVWHTSSSIAPFQYICC